MPWSDIKIINNVQKRKEKMKRFIYITFAALFIISLFSVQGAGARHIKKGPKWIYRGVEIMDDNPDVKRYKWEIVRPPFGPFDKISLYRVVKERHNKLLIPYKPAPDRRKVLFGCCYPFRRWHVFRLSNQSIFLWSHVNDQRPRSISSGTQMGIWLALLPTGRFPKHCLL